MRRKIWGGVGPDAPRQRPGWWLAAVMLVVAATVAAVSGSVGSPAPALAAPAGTVTRFGTVVEAFAVAAGPDSNVWFASPGAVGKVTPAGVVTTYTVPGLTPRADGSAITAGADGNLWVGGTGAIWRVTTAGVATKFADSSIGDVAAITAGPDGNVWFTSFYGSKIGRITPAGVVSVFTSPDVVLPEGITAGPDGNVWFASWGNGGIGRVTPAGAITVFKGSGISQPFNITQGPDGALWFTSYYNANIGRINTTGTVTTFPVAGVTGTWGITSGPDGNLWFTSSNPFAEGATGGAVGRMTTAGVSTLFTGRAVRGPTVITAGADGNLWYANVLNGTLGKATTAGATTTYSGSDIVGPGGVTAGPDDAVWFTNRDADEIGRITSAGAITTYTDPDIADPASIAAGADGNLWFTSTGNNRIGRITPAGVVTTFTHASISSPTGITAGPDGNLWFTSTGNNRIGRITPAGVVTTFTHASISAPTGITAGPDGNVWFTNSSGNTIGRITPTGTVTSFGAPGLSAPTDITRGPDGALWFPATRANDGQVVGRITTTGTITTFRDGPPGTTTVGRYSAITTGADGALWFTDPVSSRVGRLTTTGTFSFLPIDGVRDPGRIAPGPDGNIWVAAYRNSTIVRVATGVPDAPTGVQATAAPGRVTVAWTAPANGGEPPVTGYTVTASPGGKTCTWTSGPLTCTIGDLDASTSYTFRVTAANSVGSGGRSAPSPAVNPLPATAPSTPAAPVAAAGDRAATVTWSPPADDGGRPITGYTVTASPGGNTCTWTSGPLQCTVTGLTAGTPHTFTVHATNAVGDSAESAPSNPVTPVPGDLFHPLGAPTRILDSRPPPEQVGPYATPWSAGTVREVTVAGVGGVPAGATAVTLNVTVTGTTAASFLTLWPKGASQPTASNLNWTAGQTIPNAVTVKVGADGKIDVFNPSGSTNVIIDVVGYYDQSGAGAGFTSQAPVRVLDSRPAPETVGPYATPWGAGTDREVTVTGGATGVPVDAEAVVANVTVTGTSAESFLTVYPNGATKPTASSLNWKAGVTIPNAVTVKVGTGGKIRVFNNSGSANVIIDVVGYFKTGSGDAFHPVDPVRFQDSRPAPEQVGAYSTPWGPNQSRTVAVTTASAVPAGAKAVLANVTVTSTSAESFLTVWNTGAAKPTASNLNWKAGVTIANAVTAKIGTGDTISVFNNSGNVNVIADAAGWYG